MFLLPLHHFQLLLIVLFLKLQISRIAVLEWRFFDSLFGDLSLAFLKVKIIELFKACKVIVDLINQQIKLSFLYWNFHIRSTVDLLGQTFHSHCEAFQIHPRIVLPLLD